MQQLPLRLLPQASKKPQRSLKEAAAQVGAFYVCGQGGTAFWGGRGGRVLNNTFINIRNMDGTGVQGPSVQALYLVRPSIICVYRVWEIVLALTSLSSGRTTR